jgi:hypothetical protein
VTKEHLDESELAGEETIPARERVYKAIKAFEDEEGTKSDVVETTGLAEGTVKKELAALKRETPPRVWDTGRAEGRQAVVTTKETSGSGSAPIGEPEPEPVIPSREKDEQQPLSSSLKPGESATLEELKQRLKQDEGGAKKCIHDVAGGCWLCEEKDSTSENGAHTENFG